MRKFYLEGKYFLSCYVISSFWWSGARLWYWYSIMISVSPYVTAQAVTNYPELLRNVSFTTLEFLLAVRWMVSLDRAVIDTWLKTHSNLQPWAEHYSDPLTPHISQSVSPVLLHPQLLLQSECFIFHLWKITCKSKSEANEISWDLPLWLWTTSSQ